LLFHRQKVVSFHIPLRVFHIAAVSSGCPSLLYCLLTRGPFVSSIFCFFWIVQVEENIAG
jgi:hypothetical protein